MLDKAGVAMPAAPFQAVPPGTAFVLEPDDARLLTEVGFLAAGAGDTARAETIFKALRRLRPQAAYPVIGLAVAWMNAARAPEAVALLESVRNIDSGEQGLLDAWRGFALQLSGRNGESRRLLEAAARGDGAGAELARGLLGLPREGD